MLSITYRDRAQTHPDLTVHNPIVTFQGWMRLKSMEHVYNPEQKSMIVYVN